jgi:AbrB family looped-hinge helix DNA binding protein
MSATQSMTVGNKGRVVLPAEVRRSRNWSEGTVLIALDTDDGVLLMTRDDLERKVLAEFAGKGVGIVDELIAERRREAERDNAG